MIELLCKQIIDNLGATGLLVLGLYALLYRPLTTISRDLAGLGIKLDEISQLLKDISWQK